MLFLPAARSRTRGKNFTHFRGTLIWNQLPRSIKSSKSIIEIVEFLTFDVLYLESSFIYSLFL